ncbi:MAG: Uncharacterised protein [SAR116 cluster bacterium]|nr:MAG: Uncharacterised protein [SAR116 cluster bacterium]
MAYMHFGIKTGPVGARQIAAMCCESCLTPTVKRSKGCLLCIFCCVQRNGARISAAQNRIRLKIQLTHQGRFPAIPGGRANAANISHCQHQQQLKPLRRLHNIRKVGNGFWIVQIITEGGLAHQQMMAHQPAHCFRFFRRQTEVRTQLLRQLGTQNRVITTPPFGDIMQQGGNEKGPPGFDFRHNGAGNRCGFSQLACFDIVQDADHLDGVLVDGKAVIHVKLHHRHDAPEIRQISSQHTAFIHQAQNPFGIML